MNTNQRGITGLEAAIILIAFVVVALVFASKRAKESILPGCSRRKVPRGLRAA